MIANYHTHTRWCRHGSGEIEEYIQEGIRCGLKELAITEHVPLDYDHPYRLHLDEFEAYNRELDEMIEKYKGKIKVLKGFECEYYPHRMDYYQDLRERWGYEIMILGQHNSFDEKKDYFAMAGEQDLLQYTDELIQGIQTGFFTFVAHPDVPVCSYGKVNELLLTCMKRIFEACEKMDIPIEINANGMRDRRGYPDREIFTLSKEYKLRYLINSDAHEVHRLVDHGVSECEKMAEELNIEIQKFL